MGKSGRGRRTIPRVHQEMPDKYRLPPFLPSHLEPTTFQEPPWLWFTLPELPSYHGVATISRLLKITRLFFRI